MSSVELVSDLSPNGGNGDEDKNVAKPTSLDQQEPEKALAERKRKRSNEKASSSQSETSESTERDPKRLRENPKENTVETDDEESDREEISDEESAEDEEESSEDEEVDVKDEKTSTACATKIPEEKQQPKLIIMGHYDKLVNAVDLYTEKLLLACSDTDLVTEGGRDYEGLRGQKERICELERDECRATEEPAV